MNKIYNIGLIITLLFVTSCNDWLDVRSEMEVKKEDLLTNYEGVRDALTGCYMGLASRKIYGESLTMTNIESLANLWYYPNDTKHLNLRYLSEHDYGRDETRNVLNDYFLQLYNVIAQANLIIESLEGDSKIIENDNFRDILLGEAYAIRAFCHLDVLRLFGPLPKEKKDRDLPYSFKASLSEFATYCSYDEYVDFLKKDFSSAEALLKEKDPVFKYTFEQLNTAEHIEKLDNNYFAYRQFRFNYWAVRGLQARLALYIGDNDDAYEIATSIITAIGPDSKPVMTLSGKSDLNSEYLACPRECLLAISKFDMRKYVIELLFDASNALRYRPKEQYGITGEMLRQLFANRKTDANNRYQYVWNRGSKDNGNTVYPTLKKYFFKEDANKTYLMTRHQIIPLLRMSEIYLIAIESAPDLAISNSLYKTYMKSHDEIIDGDEFNNKEELNNKILNAYRIELFGEGQMFFAYKRTNTRNILWYSETMTMENYMLPIPSGEVNRKK